jgi:hypothetical protein
MSYQRIRPRELFVPKAGKLLDQTREVMRYHHYSLKTEQALKQRAICAQRSADGQT